MAFSSGPCLCFGSGHSEQCPHCTRGALKSWSRGPVLGASAHCSTSLPALPCPALSLSPNQVPGRAQYLAGAASRAGGPGTAAQLLGGDLPTAAVGPTLVFGHLVTAHTEGQEHLGPVSRSRPSAPHLTHPGRSTRMIQLLPEDPGSDEHHEGIAPLLENASPASLSPTYLHAVGCDFSLFWHHISTDVSFPRDSLDPGAGVLSNGSISSFKAEPTPGCRFQAWEGWSTHGVRSGGLGCLLLPGAPQAA